MVFKKICYNIVRVNFYWEALVAQMSILIFLLAFLKNAIYGTSVFFTGSLTSSVDVTDVLALRFLMSFAVLWLLKVSKTAAINVKVTDVFNKEKPEMKNLILAALFEPVLYMFFETLGVSMTTGITAGVVLSLMPIASCISETLILREKTTAMQKLFLLLGIIGVIYITVNTDTASGRDSATGIICLFLTVVTGALFMVFSRKTSVDFNSMEITYISAFFGMLVFNGVNVVRHIAMHTLSTYFEPYFSVDNLVGFVFLAVISTIAATAMNNYALGKIQTTVMSAFPACQRW